MASKFPEYPKVKVEYHIVTSSGTVSRIYSDRIRAEQHTPLYPGWKVIKVTTTQYDITPLDPASIDHNIDHIWSLEDYIRFINRPKHEDAEVIAFPLCDDLSHWHSQGIHTARELADYLDAESARITAEEVYQLYEETDDERLRTVM
jgi:hypothetical protein